MVAASKLIFYTKKIDNVITLEKNYLINNTIPLTDSPILFSGPQQNPGIAYSLVSETDLVDEQTFISTKVVSITTNKGLYELHLNSGYLTEGLTSYNKSELDFIQEIVDTLGL